MRGENHGRARSYRDAMIDDLLSFEQPGEGERESRRAVLENLSDDVIGQKLEEYFRQEQIDNPRSYEGIDRAHAEMHADAAAARGMMPDMTREQELGWLRQVLGGMDLDLPREPTRAQMVEEILLLTEVPEESMADARAIVEKADDEAMKAWLGRLRERSERRRDADMAKAVLTGEAILGGPLPAARPSANTGHDEDPLVALGRLIGSAGRVPEFERRHREPEPEPGYVPGSVPGWIYVAGAVVALAVMLGLASYFWQ